MTIVSIINTAKSETAAMAFSFLLAADKGVGNTVYTSPVGYLVVADDSRAVLFQQI